MSSRPHTRSPTLLARARVQRSADNLAIVTAIFLVQVRCSRQIGLTTKAIDGGEFLPNRSIGLQRIGTVQRPKYYRSDAQKDSQTPDLIIELKGKIVSFLCDEYLEHFRSL